MTEEGRPRTTRLHFSSRLPADLSRNHLARLLEEKRRKGSPVIDLTLSNPTLAGFHYPVEEILSALNDPRTLAYHPAPAGSWEARAAVSSYYCQRGQAVGPERILLTASTSEAYSLLFKLLADPGDQILVPRPSYPLFEMLAGMESLAVAPYSLVYREPANARGRVEGPAGWSIDLQGLARAATPRCRALLLVNPNNPTGSFLRRRDLDEVVSFASERGLPIISDEVFSDYAFGPDPERVDSLVEVGGAPVFCLSGLSKVAGLPQMKLAWIVTAGRNAVLEEARERLELVADTYLSVSTPVQQGAPRLLETRLSLQPQILARCRRNVQTLRVAAGAGPCRLLDVEAGWYATLVLPATRSGEGWALELLDRDGVLVQPGYFYDFDVEPVVVISLIVPEDRFREGVGRLFARAAA